MMRKTFINTAWKYAIKQAEAGDPSTIYDLLLDRSEIPLSRRARLWFVALIAGQKSIKKTRGVKSKVKSKASQIRLWYRVLTDEKFAKEKAAILMVNFKNQDAARETMATWKPTNPKKARAAVGEVFGIKASTVRDIVEKQHTYAEKKH